MFEVATVECTVTIIMILKTTEPFLSTVLKKVCTLCQHHYSTEAGVVAKMYLMNAPNQISVPSPPTARKLNLARQRFSENPRLFRQINQAAQLHGLIGGFSVTLLCLKQ